MAEYENCCSSFKPPITPSTWSDHGIPSRWSEKVNRKIHLHQASRPDRAPDAVTRSGDLVVDPAAGSFVVMHAAPAVKRGFIGCDLAYEPPRQNQLHLSASEEYSLEIAS